MNRGNYTARGQNEFCPKKSEINCLTYVMPSLVGYACLLNNTSSCLFKIWVFSKLASRVAKCAFQVAKCAFQCSFWSLYFNTPNVPYIPPSYLLSPKGIFSRTVEKTLSKTFFPGFSCLFPPKTSGFFQGFPTFYPPN